MKHLLGTLALFATLSLAPVHADIGLHREDDGSSMWSQALQAAKSTPPSPVVTNAVKYRTDKPEKQVALKAVDWTNVRSLRLLTHANIPLKVLMACIDKTRDEVQAMLAVIKEINETEKLPADERIKLHLICDREQSFRSINVSQEDFDKYMEVDRYFYLGQSDIWMQDWGEIAMVDLPGQKKQQLFILDTNRARASLAELPGTLAREWNAHYFQKPTPSRTSSGDYGGNIEVTPDGVLVIGTTSSEELRNLLAKGYAGRTAVLDTSWLQVGHVDEYMSTIPVPSAPRGYVIVKADPRAGLARIAKLPREQLDRELDQFVRTLWQTEALKEKASYWDREDSGAKRAYALLHAYHASQNGYTLDPAKVLPGDGDRTAEVAKLIADNTKIADTIDAQIALLKETIRKASGDSSTPITVVSLPALFEPFSSSGKSVAMLPGAANMVVLRNHVVVPDPLLPCLASDIKSALIGIGLKVHMVADASYHYWQGQLHCGTNVLRHPNKWLGDPSGRPQRASNFQELLSR